MAGGEGDAALHQPDADAVHAQFGRLPTTWPTNCDAFEHLDIAPTFLAFTAFPGGLWSQI